MRMVILMLGTLIGGCAQGPIGPTTQAEAAAITIMWDDQLAMHGYPAPITTWYASGDGCGTPLPGTAFANGVCVGGQISVAGDHRETEINIAWPGSIAKSSWCAAVVGLTDNIVGDAPLLWPDVSDAYVVDCRERLRAAGL